jgi:hypothetical protein
MQGGWTAVLVEFQSGRTGAALIANLRKTKQSQAVPARAGLDLFKTKAYAPAVPGDESFRTNCSSVAALIAVRRRIMLFLQIFFGSAHDSQNPVSLSAHCAHGIVLGRRSSRRNHSTSR